MKSILATLSTLAVAVLLLSGFTSAITADQILQDSKAKLESLSDLAADFSYSIQNPNMKSPVVKTGAFKYKKGMYVVDMADQAIYCDTETLWIHLKDEEAPEVTVMDYDPTEGMNIESIFKVYEASAESRLDGEETIHGTKCYKIFLAIKDQSLDYNRAHLWINKKNNLLEQVSLIDRRQTATTYEFSNIKTNSGFTETTFQLDVSKLSGVDVFDER